MKNESIPELDEKAKEIYESIKRGEHCLWFTDRLPNKTYLIKKITELRKKDDEFFILGYKDVLDRWKEDMKRHPELKAVIKERMTGIPCGSMKIAQISLIIGRYLFGDE